MPEPSAPTALTGVVERIIFLNEDNHYTIAEFRPDGGEGAARPEAVTIVGALPGVECGETLHLTGEWTRHAQHGAQFKIAGFKSELPASVYGIRKYLGSGLVPGIGRVYANKIVDAFGTETFRVLSEESARLRQVPGIGRKRAAAIKEAWDGKRAERELYIFLQTYGVSPGQCVKLVRQYGAQAQAIVTAEPYRVAREIEGIGFKTADRIAINLGFANDAPPRLDAGILFAMETLQEEGHTACGEAKLRDHAAQMLDSPSDKVASRIEALVASRQLVRHLPAGGESTPLPGSGLVQLPSDDRAERRIADAVRRVSRAGSGLPAIKIDAAIQWAQTKAGFDFHELQRAAVRNALSHKVSILTGGPGTGKTSILRALVDILRAKSVRVHLAAPTGRAAQRLAETTGGFASTIHRLLKYEPAAGFTANEAHPLATDFLVLDEASMLDTRLAAALFQAVPSRAHLLLVGDTDQLPSVGAGNVLQDLITASGAPVTRLSVIFRQVGRSSIVTTAHAINSGNGTLPPTVSDVGMPVQGDLTFIVADSAEDCVRKVVRLCTEILPRSGPGLDPVGDVQVMAPMHKGVAGVANLNIELQAAFGRGGRGLRTLAGEFRPGDKVIQLRNNYDKNLFNGDIGVVRSVSPDSGELEADFDGDTHAFARGDLGDLALAYAISIHKSQGSEYPVVVVPLLKAHFMMLQRNLLYTAVTRGRRKVYIVGEPAAYAMAVRNRESKLRMTHLREKLSSAVSA
ncbi:MAG TPA: ATP-dependent RecD-like DNA helicase [Opitutaceae bacterium]